MPASDFTSQLNPTRLGTRRAAKTMATNRNGASIATAAVLPSSGSSHRTRIGPSMSPTLKTPTKQANPAVSNFITISSNVAFPAGHT